MMDMARAAERSTRIEVLGHTDSTGAQERNLRLGRDRADRVLQALVAAGIEASLLSAKGVGMTLPAVPEVSNEQRALNRRVSIKINLISESAIARP
jgi:OOP family OmpA-OmpF porin